MEIPGTKPDGPKSRGKPRKGRGHIRPVQKKRDDDIMNTNDSSIVSKRSVSKLYFPNEPDFYEPFVQKFVRRNPLINRGYWLRMHAIEQVVLRFLNEDPHVPKVVVNLGCGYDPLPFQFWHRYASSCQNATFVDVDYPQLIQRKRDRMLMNELTRDALLKSSVRSSGAPIYLRSDRYMAVGCDLKDLKTLETVLRNEFDMASTAIVFVAEVSITYMPLVDAQALIEWAERFDNAQFCLLEQYLPQGPDHPFAHTMLKHFNKLQTPIQAVKDYPSLALQKSRFTKYGWSVPTMQNLWDLWSDDTFTPPEVRRCLDAVEPFDEWEEFALFAGHYFLLVASNRSRESSACEKEAHKQPDAQVEPGGLPSKSTESISLTHGSDVTVTSRRFAAAFALRADTLGIHGGQGVQSRLTSIDVLCHENPDRSVSDAVIPILPSPQARICHTITSVADNTALLVGGRTSPSHALSECWYLHDQKWETTGQLQPARFRHAAAGVSVSPFGPEIEGEVASGVYVFGGKTSEGHILDDSVIWRPNQGWQILPVVGNVRPPARFGAAICTPGAKNWGLIMGGMTSDGTVLGDVWEFRITAAPSLQIQFTDRTRDIQLPIPNSTAHARFGASLVQFGEDMLLVGGVARKELLSLSEDFLLVSARGPKISFEVPKLSMSKDTWPLLVGAGVIPVSDNEVVIASGGAVCFSMGSFWNEGYFSITKAGSPQPSAWSVQTIEQKPAEVEGVTKPSAKPKTQGRQSKGKGRGKGKDARDDKSKATTKPKETTVRRIQIQSAEDFSQLVKESEPAIIQHLDLGACTHLWTLSYLEEKLGGDREIVIHDSTSSRMTFASKNFTYEKTTISAFLNGIARGAKTYLRAISAAQPNKLPTKLEDDFPSIAQGFQLPKVLADVIGDTYHSSPLRISGPVSLWLHYDVLANVLCQIQGSKTLRLYPPSDVRHLGYPPGGSSSNIDVLDPTANEALKNTHPHIAQLRPGDVLFIPPMWSHTATPDQGHSVAVNVFFRNLGKGYAAGKDVYGNRDLQGYETGRRDVEKIVRAFKDVPSDLAKFYLERLGGEILDKAEGLSEGKE